MANKIAFIGLHHLRTRLLVSLDAVYPRGLDVETLRSADQDKHGLTMVRREVAYLRGKGLARRKKKRKIVVITPRGRDFLTGDVAEVGLEPSDTFGYRGPEGIS